MGAAVVSSALLLSATSASAQTPGLLNASSASRGETGLRPLLHEVVDAGVPGVVVRTQQGKTVQALAAGVSDISTKADMRPTARFRASSITRSFVVTVVLQLVQEGRLGLDEPVEKYLPGMVTSGETITVRRLLQHTSGLADYTADADVLAGIVTNRGFTQTELVRIAQASPGSNRPGAAFSYNYIVAGLLIEAVTGHHLAQELGLRSIGPLHLTSTSFPSASPRIRGDHAHGNVPTELVPTPDGQPTDVTGLNPSAAWAACARVSDTAALSHFYQADHRRR